jgi:RHS repeat-associated protein
LADLTNGGPKVQITRTVYDTPYVPMSGTSVPINGSNLRNRVAYTAVIDQENTNVPEWRAATFYSYDPHGNVDTLLQDYGPNSVMGQDSGNRFKTMIYDYDLVSGKVNQVSYQPGKADAFYHQYTYDAENRLIGVSTSRDSIQWENDAAYTYYRHGPLARLDLGSLQLQGIDYSYTLQGWLKSINPSWITPSGTAAQYDSDGVSTIAYFERDAYKLNLNYFDDGTYTDFRPINPLTGYVQGNALPSGSKRNLYNGNIASQALNIRQIGVANTTTDGGPMLYNYGYDQLNRISSMDAWAANDSLKPTGSGALQDYAERYTYDPNGNIMTLGRNAASGGGTAPTAQLTYKYRYANTSNGWDEYTPGSAPTSGVSHLTNQLSSIQVSPTGTQNPNELQTQSAFNYQYNEIGQLTGDSKSGVNNVVWNVYGKILSLIAGSDTITFTYDAAGNRISKRANGVFTWYVRDAQGNVLSVYTQGNSAVNGGTLTQSEAHLYGSSRLGLLNLSLNCTSLSLSDSGSLVRGNKLFELTNHLGNVLETISDKKLQHTSDNSTVDYYFADVINANDYYSFGMQMPGRAYATGSASQYRYGFNGKENDNEVKGNGDQIDYGMRTYDPRVGKFLSVDPLANKYPQLTPYQYANDNPIMNVDLDGLEGFWYFFKHGDWMGAINSITWDDVNEGADQFNRTVNPVGIVVHNGYQMLTGSDLITGQKVSRADAFSNLVILAIYHRAFVEGTTPTGAAALETQMADNTVKTPNKAATTAHGGNTEASTTGTQNGVVSGAASEKTLQVGSYEDMTKANFKTGMSSDHIPSFAALRRSAEQFLGRPLTDAESTELRKKSLTLVYDTKIHQTISATFGGRNGQTQIARDAANLLKAIQKDINALKPALLKAGYTEKEIGDATEKLLEPYRPKSNTTSNSNSSTTASSGNN